MSVDALLPVGGELTTMLAGAIDAGAIAGDPRILGHDLAGTLGYVAGSLRRLADRPHIGRAPLERHGHLVRLGPANL